MKGASCKGVGTAGLIDIQVGGKYIRRHVSHHGLGDKRHLNETGYFVEVRHENEGYLERRSWGTLRRR